MDPTKRPVVVAPPTAGYHGFQGVPPTGTSNQYGYHGMPPPGPMYPPPGAMHPTPLKQEFRDVELGNYGQQPPLYPYIAPEENSMRWAFIRKVYIILSMQLILTAIIAGLVAFHRPVSEYIVRTPGLIIGIAFLPFIVLCPLYRYHEKFPVNLILLALFTAGISLTVGLAAAFTKGKVIWESALLTAVVVFSLTLYTFWAARRGHDFSFLGPILFSSLLIIIVFIILQVFFPFGRLAHMIIGGIASLIFSGYIIYDTDNLIKRYTYDQYVWASVSLYLDIINLFLSLMTFFRAVN